MTKITSRGYLSEVIKVLYNFQNNVECNKPKTDTSIKSFIGGNISLLLFFPAYWLFE